MDSVVRSGFAFCSAVCTISMLAGFWTVLLPAVRRLGQFEDFRADPSSHQMACPLGEVDTVGSGSGNVVDLVRETATRAHTFSYVDPYDVVVFFGEPSENRAVHMSCLASRESEPFHQRARLNAERRDPRCLCAAAGQQP
jgi:hypothetical protein